MAGKKAMNVWLSEESAAGWRAFASSHDVTVTGLAEAVGLVFGADHPPLSKVLVAEIVLIARQVDEERRARRPS